MREQGSHSEWSVGPIVAALDGPYAARGGTQSQLPLARAKIVKRNGARALLVVTRALCSPLPRGRYGTAIHSETRCVFLSVMAAWAKKKT